LIEKPNGSSASFMQSIVIAVACPPVFSVIAPSPMRTTSVS